MGLIHVLDEVTANQIAAGEVVERPVNAVKELVENAVDAGSSEIEIEIADGGLTYIRVTDNGQGMSEEDAKLSIVRHATSKISSVENIYHIASLGFRGEALPSIMSISRGSITTRREEDTMGTLVEIKGGKVIETRPIGAPAGTTVEVRELFYNVPARKKFLKSERAEASRINQMVGKLALANPDIAFRLINNGRCVIETPGNGRLLDAISALYGTDVSKEMLEVENEGENVFLSGMISKPSLLKSSRQYQTLIINRRVVESAAVSKAVDNAYHSLLPKNGYPLMVLTLNISTEEIDVNVHPQKREIKFSDEQGIFRLVYHGVLNALTSQTSANAIAKEMVRKPSYDVVDEKETKFSVGEPVTPSFGLGFSAPPPVVPPLEAQEEKENPSWKESEERMAPKFSFGNQKKEEPVPYEAPISKKEILSNESVFAPLQQEQEEQMTPLFDAPKEEEIPIIPLGQVSDCYILCSHGKDLFIIDQHAAHERVRYDRLAERAEGIPTQEMLVPLLLKVEADDISLLEERREEVERLGISFEQAGVDVIRITGVPGDFSEEDTKRVMDEILISFHNETMHSPETLRHRMMAYAACRGAIKQGDPLNIRQMRELIRDLFATKRPFVCPHGRPTIVKFTPTELGHLFKRP